MNDIMIKIESVSKKYRLGTIGGGTLQGDIQSWWARMRGKEDPNSKIGSKAYSRNESFLALSDISLDIKVGERVGIIGHNGAGKSTLLKLLSRVTAPSEGEIGLNGRITSMLEVGTGFHAELTGRENVYLNGAILGMTKKEIDAKMEDIIEFSEVRQFIDTPVKRYSSGMYVKLAFSVAAHLDSEIMIMDEVLAVGDMAFQKKCLDKMNDVSRKDGRTILYVSHNMNTIRQLCDRCVVLDHGKVIYDGEVEQAIALYMGLSSDSIVHYDYSACERADDEKRQLQMLGMDLLDLETACVKRGESLNMIMHCYGNEDFNEIGLRFEIFAGGGIIGTTFLDKSVSGKKGDAIDLHISIDTSSFAPAQYKVVALLYETDEWGNQCGIDRIDSALVFRVDAEEGELVWLPHYWGYTRFKDMKLIAINDRPN